MSQGNSIKGDLKSLERITFITDRDLFVEQCCPERIQKHFIRDILVTKVGISILAQADELFNEKDLIVLDKELEINFGKPAFAVLGVEYTDEGLSDADISQIRNLLFQAGLSN